MSEKDKIVSRMQNRTAEMQYQLKVLELWNLVDSVGIEVDTVQAFTFHENHLPPKERERYRKLSWAERQRAGELYHNCVRLKTGELKPIPLTKRVYPPKETE